MKIGDLKTCIVLPCSASKEGRGSLSIHPRVENAAKWIDSRPTLVSARQALDRKFRVVQHQSITVPALLRYSGHMYPQYVKQELSKSLLMGNLDVIIISGGYGLVHGTQPISNYECEMKGPILRFWRDNQLGNIIAEYVKVQKIKCLIGFFASSGGYKDIFRDAQRRLSSADSATSNVKVCYYTVTAGGSTGATPKALTQVLLSFLKSDQEVSEFLSKTRVVDIFKTRVELKCKDDRYGESRESQPLRQVERTETMRTQGTLRSEDFRSALIGILKQAECRNQQYVDVRAGDLHRSVGGYTGNNHRMPMCCQVMRNFMGQQDQVITEPPSGKGASLTIRYFLPRPGIQTSDSHNSSMSPRREGSSGKSGFSGSNSAGQVNGKESIGERLRELKRLFGEGLIPESVYVQKMSDILRDL